MVSNEIKNEIERVKGYFQRYETTNVCKLPCSIVSIEDYNFNTDYDFESCFDCDLYLFCLEQEIAGYYEIKVIG